MALVLADRVLETTTTAGSGTITLVGAEPGYQSFSAVGDGNQTYYTIAGDTEWEVGVGTYTASGTTLSRDTVLSSSDSGSKVGFSAGIKKVFVTYPSEKSVNRDVSGNISASTGKIINLAEPTDSADAATKLYVDTLAAQGITYHSPVKYEVPNTTGNLTATYNNGTAGVSATLTNAGTLAAFVPDGVTATISDRILVYSQTNAFENGVYTVTVVGDGSTSWVLTRATDADTYALKSPNSLGAGDAFYVTSGNTGAGETYLCNTSGVITFGTTPINFVQISAAQVYSAGNGLSLTNTTFSLATPVAVSNGGTGTSATPTNGQLLIGNGSNYTLATLTAGSGVSITNSAGSITLSATGSGGTVTAVTATGPLASTGGTTPDISIANSTGTGSVVLDNGPIIYSATITGAVSASITTITGTSANITTVSGTNLSYASATITTGNLTFSGTGQRITGDMSNATVTNRLMVQTSTTNGNTLFSVMPNGTGTAALVRAFNSSTPAQFVDIRIDGTEAQLRSSYEGTSTFLPLTFYTGGSERMRLDTSGNLGIGTASPAVKLNVIGDVQFSRSATASDVSINFGSNSNNYIYGGNANNIMAFATNGSERMRIDSSGNVGIGTASPGFLFDTFSSSAAVDYIAGRFYSGAAPSGESRTWLKVEKGANYGGALGGYIIQGVGGGLLLGTQNGASTPTERMRIDSSGNVGIGGTAEAYARVNIQGTLPTSGGTSVGFLQTGTVPSGSTSAAYCFHTNLNTQAASFTCANAYHYSAYENSKGAGSSITNQYGFYAWANLTGATNNYGFYSNIDSAANRWNFYAAGTARNYFAGGVEDAAGNLRNIPSAGTTKTSAYTLTVSDIGEFVTVGSSGSVVVPNSTFSAGNAITIYNDTTGNVSINISLTTCYVAGTNTNRSGVTLATRGVATILFISGTYGVISGNVT